MKPTEKVERHITTEDTLMDLLRNLFPPNIVQACTQQMSTQLIVPDNYSKDSEDNKPKHEWTFQTNFQNNTNILGKILPSEKLNALIKNLQVW